MCRFLAYLGPDVSLESLLLAPPWSLLRQSYEPRFMRRGRVNADGFGAGWYDFGVREEPALYPRATPHPSRPRLAALARPSPPPGGPTDGRTVAATACGGSLYVQEDAPGFVVASEPYDDRPGWQEVPDGSVIEATDDGSPLGLRIGGVSR